MVTTKISGQCDNGHPRLEWGYLQMKGLGHPFLNLLILDVGVYICHYSQRQYLWQHPCWRKRVRVGCLEMGDEFFL